MLIQIHGGGFHNRGAQLMLWTTIQEIHKRIPNVQLAVEPCFSTYQERASYDLLTIAPGVFQNRPRKAPIALGLGGRLSAFLPSATANTYGIARRCDIDALVDISGYAFGDKWGTASPCATMARRVAKMVRKGKPVILLPQMFGPFETPSVAQAFKPVVADATLIYARDDASLECLKSINTTGRDLLQAPDITIFSEAILPDAPFDAPYACLVPNARMLDKGDSSLATDYIDLMAAAAKKLHANGITPRILIHDGTNEDEVLGRKLLGKIDLTECDLIQESNPRKIKGIISQSKMLIGSRFHAIVASLSTGVPAISLGWAHKYGMLMKDFGVPQYLYKHQGKTEDLLLLIEQLIDPKLHKIASTSIRSSKEEMRHLNQAMWDNVSEHLLLNTK